jgi:chromosome segregation ATPase
MSVEQMKAKTTNQLAELGKKSEAVARLKVELAEKSAAIAALEERERAVKDQLRATEEEVTRHLERLRELEGHLGDRDAGFAQMAADLDERNVTADSQRIEIVALNTQIATLKTRVEETEHELRESERSRIAEHEQSERLMQALRGARREAADLGGRIADLERQLSAGTAQGAAAVGRVRELELSLEEQGRSLAQRERDCHQLAVQLANARNLESDLRAELAAQEGRRNTAMKAQQQEKQQLQQEIERAGEERGRLQREIAALQHEGTSSWAAERMENALLRERINDIAAEIARLTALLEGADSPIEQILALPVSQPRANGPGPQFAGEAAPPLLPERTVGNLADRIRALQSRAPRLTTPS